MSSIHKKIREILAEGANYEDLGGPIVAPWQTGIDPTKGIKKALTPQEVMRGAQGAPVPGEPMPTLKGGVPGVPGADAVAGPYLPQPAVPGQPGQDLEGEEPEGEEPEGEEPEGDEDGEEPIENEDEEEDGDKVEVTECEDEEDVLGGLKKEANEECGDEDGVVVSEEEEEENPEEKHDVGPDVDALFAGEDLPDSFKEKAVTIFQAAIARFAKEYKKASDGKAQKQVDEAVRLVKRIAAKKAKAYEKQLTEQVDLYLGYVVEQWMDQNKLAVERGIRAELAEDFISGLKDLFVEHYIEVPESKVDALKVLEQKLSEVETKLNEQVDVNVKMRGQLISYRKDAALRSVSAGLPASQVEKLRGLAEGVEYTNRREFTEKLTTLRESYCKKSAAPVQKPEVKPLNESVIEPIGNSNMDMYFKTISKSQKK